MTETARASKRLFWLWVVVAVLSSAAVVLDDDRDWSSWLGIVLALFGVVYAVLYLRSWRLLRRTDSERTP